MRALFVTADPCVAHAISLMLKAGGIVTDETCSGQEAVTMAQRRSYDVILLDLSLRDADGLETLAVLRRVGNAPVLALGSSSQGEERMRALDLGAKGYLSKPFDRRELIASVRAVTGRALKPETPAAERPTIRRAAVARTGAFNIPSVSSAAWD